MHNKVLLHIRLNKHYFLLALTIFLSEVDIAIYIHDTFVRPFLGDLLVVILLYCAIRAVANTNPFKTALWVLILAYLIEVSQHFHLIQLLGWQNSKIAPLLLGTSFSFVDILMYTLGVLIIITVETIIRHERSVKYNS